MTKVTERGQVSIPAQIRECMQMTPGTNLLWNRGRNPYTCTITIVQTPQRKGAKAMLGYASTFRKPRTTAEWMKELREGEQANDGLITRNASDFRALFPSLNIVTP